MSGKLVLVTGVTGFIAGHVANQLLEKGYRVRGTTRGAKVQTLRDTIKVAGLEFTQVDDVATSDISEALKDVYAVVHVASPMPGRTGVDDTLNSAIDGTVNVLRQVEKAGIKKIVVTSSVGAILDPSLAPAFAGLNLTDSEWGVVTREQAQEKADDPFYVYFASKILAERAVWEFVKEHPAVDVATILPGFVFGPFADHFPWPSKSGLGTNQLPWDLINGQHPHVIPSWFVDVRDVAKGHILALDVPPKPLEEKRYLINAGNFTWKQGAEYLKKARPELNVAEIDTFPDYLPGPLSTIDTTRAKQVLNFGDYIKPEKTVEDVVDNLLEVSKTW
ncbi:hypothetical protein BDQ12DRAFT_707710 [Crucibulum laeve]|uniref:NAD-dependent epimerase/dehydratase domain-containing protein n=1 Tax=Crucibulum laeve TaxID=68775 RepID=A0A5C3LGQ2_9AGAR|nr:hypothetical protein BDQ12DRAFT_707710 [Crucibulum laeve]